MYLFHVKFRFFSVFKIKYGSFAAETFNSFKEVKNSYIKLVFVYAALSDSLFL